MAIDRAIEAAQRKAAKGDGVRMQLRLSLSPGRIVELTVPADITRQEAARLANACTRIPGAGMRVDDRARLILPRR